MPKKIPNKSELAKLNQNSLMEPTVGIIKMLEIGPNFGCMLKGWLKYFSFLLFIQSVSHSPDHRFFGLSFEKFSIRQKAEYMPNFMLNNKFVYKPHA